MLRVCGGRSETSVKSVRMWKSGQMRVSGISTWIRLAVLSCGFFVFPWMGVLYADRYPNADAGVFSLIVVILLLLPLWTAACAFWDGGSCGFSVLWVVVPSLAFVVPMFAVYNSSAAVYMAAYAVMGVVFSGMGTWFFAGCAAALPDVGEGPVKLVEVREREFPVLRIGFFDETASVLSYG